MFKCVHLLAHCAGVADDAAGPVEHPLAFCGKALEAGAAVHQQHPKGGFQLLYPRGKGRLGNPACLSGAPEMPFTREGKKKFELFEQFWSRSARKGASSAIVPLLEPTQLRVSN